MPMDALQTGEQPGLVARARDILIRPQSEWRRIAGEDAGSLIRPYVLPLALLGALVSFAASVLYAGNLTLNAALAWRAVSALLYVVLAVFGVLLSGWLIGVLAPRFGAEPNGDRARQLAAYSATPVLVSALGAVAPPIAGGLLAVGVIYAFVLLALGMQPLMPLREPENNVPRFALTFAALAAALAVLAAAFIGPFVTSGREALTGAIETVAPPPAAPDLPRTSAAEAAIDRLSQADATLLLVDPARLEEQFPDSLPGGFARQSVVKAQGGGVSRADGIYRDSGATLSVSIIQYSANVEPAALATLLNVKPDAAIEGGYNRTQTIDGRFYAEEVSATASRYIVIGRGVIMIAEGGVTMDQARAAVETIGLQRLEGMFGR